MMTDADRKALMEIADVVFDEPMRDHTTFKVGGPAEAFVSPDRDELPLLLKCARDRDIPVIILGNGSNVLVSDDGLQGLVISIGRNISGISVIGSEITCGAGEMISAVSRAAANAGLSGLEFAAGIPGSAGGAVVMNGGAYGGQISDVLTKVEILTAGLQFTTLAKDELALGYRHSIFMEEKHRGDIILSASMELTLGDEEEIFAAMEDFNARRRDKQPLNYPSAGSTFKRPEGYFAGALIEQSGLKGFKYGGAMVSDKHCGFVINTGDASASDILYVINHIKDVVYEKTGVTLEEEVRIL